MAFNDFWSWAKWTLKPEPYYECIISLSGNITYLKTGLPPSLYAVKTQLLRDFAM